MDIPESGAVFTLGKSYLSENHQSYFFIKNDPIKKIITGSNQSAVICESGRLFVWGENQYGQLATSGGGSKDIVKKPSCVKVIKNLGYKVRNIAFGEAFSVIITENSKVFFNGKSIFTLNETYGNKLWNLGNGDFVTRQNYEIDDFHRQCLDADGNLDDLVDVVAGQTHFVVLTNSGKLFCYGLFDSTKLKRHKNQLKPQKISDDLVVRIAKCGSSFTTFVTDCNEIYLIGKFNGIEYTKSTKLNTSELKDSIYCLYVSKQNEIFLISSAGDVYKNTNETEIRFERIILFNNNDVIRKFGSGSDFVCVLTDKNTFLTTFKEKTVKNNAPITPPRELRKFQDLNILDFATGLHHILLFAVSKSNLSTSFDISSSDANENFASKELLPETNENFIQTNSGGNRLICEDKEIKSEEQSRSTNQTSILSKQTLEAIYSDTESTSIERKVSSDQLHTENPKMENAIGSSVSKVGESLREDVNSIVTSGKAQITELTDGAKKTVQEIPGNVTDYAKNVIAPKIDSYKEQANDTKNEILDGIFDEVKQSKNFLKQASIIQQPESQHDVEHMDRNEKIKHELEKDEKIEVLVDDDLENSQVNDEIKFIDNGADVTASNIVQTMNDEIKEMSNDGENKIDELTMQYDKILGEELGTNKEAFTEKLFHTKNDEKSIRDVIPAVDSMTKIISLKHDLEEIDLDGDGDTERTTASIKSVSTPTKNPFDHDDMDDPMENVTQAPAPANVTKEHSDGRVKRFLNEIKSNCKTADTVVEVEETAVQQIKSHSMNDIIGDNKTSKVCTIL